MESTIRSRITTDVTTRAAEARGRRGDVRGDVGGDVDAEVVMGGSVRSRVPTNVPTSAPAPASASDDVPAGVPANVPAKIDFAVSASCPPMRRDPTAMSPNGRTITLDGGSDMDDDGRHDAYPWLGTRDERFTLALVLDLAEVLTRHGYPAPAGDTLAELTAGLYRALHPVPGYGVPRFD